MILPDGFDKNNVLHIKLDSEGCFNAVVRYNGVPLNQGQLTVISLNCKCFFCVQANLKCLTHSIPQLILNYFKDEKPVKIICRDKALR